MDKKKFIPLLALLLAVIITVVLFLYRDRVAELEGYGYLGAFLISLVSNASVILPVPGLLVLVALGSILHPVGVGLAGGIGAAIGEITGYMAGYSGRGLAQRSKMYNRVEGWMRRWGTMTIFIFSLVPFFPFDLAGIVAGALRFPFWKFFLLCWLGRTLLYIGVALAGAWGWGAIFMEMSPAAIAFLAALATGVLLVIILIIERWAWKLGW